MAGFPRRHALIPHTVRHARVFRQTGGEGFGLGAHVAGTAVQVDRIADHEKMDLPFPNDCL